MRTILPVQRRFIGVAIGIVVLIAFSALFGDRPSGAMSVERRLLPPSLAFPFGTDLLGRDMAARVARGLRVTLGIAAGTVGLSTVGGVVLAVAVSVVRKSAPQTRRLAGIVIDGAIAFPGFLMVLIVAATVGASGFALVIALGASGVPGYGRYIIGVVENEFSREYVTAARATGASRMWILLRHIAPNVLPPLVVFMTSRLSSMLLVVGALSYLGFGVQPPTPELGALIAQSGTYAQEAPWLIVYPGIVLGGIAFLIHAIGDILHDTLVQ